MTKEVKNMMTALLTGANNFTEETVTGFVNNEGTAMAFYRQDEEDAILVNFTSEAPSSENVEENLYFVIDGEGIFHYHTREKITLEELQDKLLDFKNENF